MLTQSQIRYYWSPRCTGPFATVSLYGSGKVIVDAAIVSAVKALNQVLAAFRYSTRAADTGAYNCRMNTSGTAWSIHAYGCACDINWLTNPYYRYLKTDMPAGMPRAICAIRTNNGKQVWNWGGYWSGNKDAMHYEIVCTPADLRTGINWSTVSGAAPAPTPTPTPTPTPVQPEEEGPMYRIVWFKGEPTAAGDQPDVTAAYRCVYAKAEKSSAKDKFICVEGWWIKNTTELTAWKNRGLYEANKSSAPAPLRSSIALHGGPYANTP